MTCIVGIEKGGRVYLAGDIQGTGGNSKVVHTQPKVYKVGDMVVGFSGSYRFGQIIENYLKDPFVPDKNASVYKWLVQAVVPQIIEILDDHGYYGSDDEEGSTGIVGGNCLIGVRDELWELQDDFSLLRSTRGYMAIGSGCEYALAATEALRTRVKSPDKLLKDVLSITSIHCPSVGKDAVVIHT